MRYLFTSGGSAGHLAPLVAVSHAIKKLDPSAEIAFVCSDQPGDREYLHREKITPALVLPRPTRNLLLPFTLMRDYKEAARFIDTWKPDVVFTKGAAVSVPVCYAAHRRKIPIVVHESDAVMGNANRVIARWAEKICWGFEEAESAEQRAQSRERRAESRERFSIKQKFHHSNSLRSTLYAHRFVITGNPIRPHLAQGSKAEGLKLAGLKGGKPILLICGGSQGATAINEAVAQHIDPLLELCDIIHLTGRGKKGSTKREGYFATEFVHDELPHFFAAATVALSRAGAGTISELAANAIPTILVPIRGLAHDHQFRNATTAQENGGCILLLQEDLDAKIVSTVRVMLADTARRDEISKKMSSLHHPDASLHIAKIIVGCVAPHGASH